jgi:pimeloyl-ACP methyl ester carboxylesterase
MLYKTVNDTQFAYVDQGGGTALLLVHGFPLDHTMWAAQIDALSTSCRVIAPDLRGFGRTPLGDTDPQTGISMQQFARDLAALLDVLAIREPIVLCGFSMGGYIAMQFVRMYPERLRALILCDTRTGTDTAESRAGRLKMAEHVAEWGTARIAEMMGPNLFAPETFTRKPELVAAARRVVTATAPEAIAAAQRGIASRDDTTELLPQIKVPSLVIVGEADAISTRDEMQSIASAIPNCRFETIPEAGHMAPVENPSAVNKALKKFLDELAK